MSAARTDTVTDEYSRPVPGAKIYVYNADGTDAVLTADGVSPLTQPVTTDEFGTYTYWTADGYYREDIWYGGKLRFRQSGVAVGTTADVLSDAVASATAAASLALSGASLISLPTGDGAVMPEMYGAVGNGVANDTAAFQAMAADINAASGGVIELRPGAIYLVGLQTLVAGHVWAGQPVLTLSGCTRPLTIRGNGAKFKFASGLKYGVFDSAGNPVTHALPYSGGDYSYPVPEAIVSIKDCTGTVTFASPLEIDGNEANLTWGGVYGDTGWQVPGDGLWLKNCSGGVLGGGIYSHHCPRDGLIVWGGGDPTNNASSLDGSVLSTSRFEYNCRQGMSFVGGQGWTFIGCRFKHTGMGSHYSAPGAGVDLEQESGIVRNHKFILCEFVDNTGAGLVCDNNNADRVSFERCRFIGTVSYSAWVKANRFHFSECLFAGPVQAQASYEEDSPPNPMFANNALLFDNSIFTDDVTYSPTGALYGGSGLATSENLLNTRFRKCHFRGSYSSALLLGPGGWYEHCTIDGGSINSNCTDLNLVGRTAITDSSANTVIQFTSNGANSVLGSDIFYNGTQMRRGSATWDPPNLAAGARTTTTVSVPFARFRDRVKVTANASLQGLTLGGYVSTQGVFAGGSVGGGVVTVTLDNFTGGAVNLGSLTIDVALEDRELQ